MPYAQWHYPFEHEAEFQAHFPADFICEGVDQTRGWFYSLLAIADDGVRQPGLPARDRERAGARRRGPEDVEEPRQRRQPVGDDRASTAPTRCGSTCSPRARCGCPSGSTGSTIKDVGRQVLQRAQEQLRVLRRSTPATGRRAARPRRPSGRWWTAGCSAGSTPRSTAVRRGLERSTTPTAGVRALMEFVVDDVSQWYVRANRARFWAVDSVADPAALATLHEALVTVSRLLAPAAPFVSDWLHRALEGTSVHLARFPGDGRTPGAGARGGDGRGAPAGLAGPRRPAGAQAAGAAAAGPDAGGGAGGGARRRRSTSCSSCSGSR